MYPLGAVARTARGLHSDVARAHAGTQRMRALQILVALTALSYVAALVLAQHHVVYVVPWTYNAFFVLLIFPILLRARHSARLGVGWTSIAVFGILYELGNVARSLPAGSASLLHGAAVSEVCYLASFVALVVGVGWLTQRTFGVRMLSVRLDGAIVALAVGSVAAAIRFQSIPHGLGGRPSGCGLDLPPAARPHAPDAHRGRSRAEELSPSVASGDADAWRRGVRDRRRRLRTGKTSPIPSAGCPFPTASGSSDSV